MFDYYEQGLIQERVELLKINNIWRDYREYLLIQKCVSDDEILCEEL